MLIIGATIESCLLRLTLLVHLFFLFVPPLSSFSSSFSSSSSSSSSYSSSSSSSSNTFENEMISSSDSLFFNGAQQCSWHRNNHTTALINHSNKNGNQNDKDENNHQKSMTYHRNIPVVPFVTMTSLATCLNRARWCLCRRHSGHLQGHFQWISSRFSLAGYPGSWINQGNSQSAVRS